jgi:hypothetical protein
MVYDCGALGHECRRALLREIEGFAAQISDGEQLDLLVLSHLDSDHCNGVEELLARCGADTVMLPYLTDEERVLEMASTASKGSLTGSAIEMLTDPTRWLRDRGVRRVIQVDPAEGGDIAPLTPPDPTPPPEQLTKVENAQFDLQPSFGWLPPEANEHRLKAGELLRLSYLGSDAWWIFAPFAYRPSDALLTEFRHGVLEMLRNARPPQPPSIVASSLRTLLTDVRTRRELAHLYNLFGHDRNVTSLALYSGPALGGGLTRVYWNSRGSLGWLGEDRLAWLGTGDWQLKTRKKCRLFIQYYSRLADHVGVFALPHHGSRHNAPPPDFWNWLRPHQVIIAAGSRGDHPHPEVTAGLRPTFGNDVFTVTERPESRWRDSMRLEWG